MCGIVGMAGNLTTTNQSVFRDMLLFDVVRGIDSTGFVGVPLKSAVKNSVCVEPTFCKEVGLPTELFKGNPNIFNKNGKISRVFRVLIGHNRAATIGNITKENAHPFDYKNIIGVHNGSLIDWGDLDGANKIEVDSQAMMNHINNKGVVDAWSNFIGPAAIVVWDKLNDKLLLSRNKDRPLYIAWNDRKDILIWASESWMIKQACERNGLKLGTYIGEDENTYLDLHQLPIDEMHVFDVSNVGVKLLKTTPLKQKTPKVKHMGFGLDHWDYGNEYNRFHSTNFMKGGSPTNGLCTNWTKNMKRCDKFTRKLSFIIDSGPSTEYKGVNKYSYYIGRFVEGDTIHMSPVFRIYFDGDKKKFNDLQNCSDTNIIFKTTARIRYSETNNHKVYATGISNIIRTNLIRVGMKRIYNDLHPSFKDVVKQFNSEELDQLFNERHEGKYIHPDTGNEIGQIEWENLVKVAGLSCQVCNTKFKDLSHAKLLTSKICLCEECFESQLVKDYLTQIQLPIIH